MSDTATTGGLKDSTVVFQADQGGECAGTLLKLTRFSVAFEMYNPAAVLRTSEVLEGCKVTVAGRTLYSGKAVVRSLINTGSAVVVCEATLSENSWTDVQLTATNGQLNKKISSEYQGFMQEWQKLYKVRPEFKVVVADMQSYLTDFGLWLNQMELHICSLSSAERAEIEHKVIKQLADPVARTIDTFIEKFETIVTNLDLDLQAVYQAYLRRQLHPLLLGSPFASRTFHKPLGYAGDYEMVDMMLRPPYEGDSLFAKIINVWLLGQSPATAHRNRVTYLTGKLMAETVRCRASRRVARVLNLGCGPAQEVQRFLVEQSALSSHMDLTLLDFNKETLVHTRALLDGIKKKQRLHTPIKYVKESVYHILKEGCKTGIGSGQQKYDFVYCAGLFDYLSDQVCKRLMNIFYDMLTSGGLLLATNVSDAMNSTRPFRYSMEYILDWHLIYRDGSEVAALAPDAAPSDRVRVITEGTGVNVFIEVRKPDNV